MSRSSIRTERAALVVGNHQPERPLTVGQRLAVDDIGDNDLVSSQFEPICATAMKHSVDDRIAGALKGLAIGDAVGKQTEMLSPEGVRRWYPAGLRGFEGRPGDVIPRYAGHARYEWRIGETTDDTECTLAVARAILGVGEVRHTSVGRELLTCTKSVHPGVASLWEFQQAGDPARVTDRHDGCGAAIRMAPVGLLYRPHHFEAIVVGAREASISTHGGPLALAAAAATAAAVSAAIDGAAPGEMLTLAERAAARAEAARSGSTTVLFAPTIRAIHDDLCRSHTLDAADLAAKYFPSHPLAIVPLALALGTVMDDASAAVLLATNVGGDADSVASIAGAILGARRPDTINEDWVVVVEGINHHGLAGYARALSAMRR